MTSRGEDLRAPGSHPSRGMREAHAHLFALGQAMQRLDLSRCRSVHECLERVREEASRLRVIHKGDASAWLLAWGVRTEGWSEARWPTMRELDGACSDRPCFLAGFDHHSCAVNTLAFASAGFDERSPDPDGGVIARDAAGKPSGLLLEAAYVRARDSAPMPSVARRRAMVKDACDHLAGLGFGEAHDLLAQPWLPEVLADLDQAGELAIRVGLFAPMEGVLNEGGVANGTHPSAFAQFDEMATRESRWGSQKIRFLGGKVFADGTLNSGTAAVLEPYARPGDGGPLGSLLMEKVALSRAMEHMARASEGRTEPLTLAVHAIGDRAVREVLDARQEFNASARRTFGLRIEHCELIDATDVPRFAELDAIASVQPCHLLYDVEVLRRQFPSRLDRVLPLRELIDSGLKPGETLLFGSDVPIVPANPSDSIQAAVSRRRQGTPEREAIAPVQAITEAEAWACFGG